MTKSALRSGGVLIVRLALGAYLMSAGAPLLHAAIHGVHLDHHASRPAADRIQHDHDAIHPASLHDTYVVPVRGFAPTPILVPSTDFGVLPARAQPFRFSLALRAWTSRAPPSDAPTRAPPV